MFLLLLLLLLSTMITMLHPGSIMVSAGGSNAGIYKGKPFNNAHVRGARGRR